MLSELHDMTWDFVCFSETRAAAAECELHGNHKLISHRGEGYGGVSVLIHSSWADHVVAKRSYGDRVLAVRLLKGGV